MKVAAACVTTECQIGLFFWAQDEAKNIYPLAEWVSDPSSLDFDFYQPLKDWIEKGLKTLYLAYSDRIPMSEQQAENHPLYPIVQEENLGIDIELKPFYQYQGLARMAGLMKNERLKGEHYSGMPKLIALLSRGDTLDKHPSALAFIFAMAIAPSRADRSHLGAHGRGPCDRPPITPADIWAPGAGDGG